MRVKPHPEFDGDKYFVPKDKIPDKAAFIGAFCCVLCVAYRVLCAWGEMLAEVCVGGGEDPAHLKSTQHPLNQPTYTSKPQSPGLFPNDLAIGAPSPPKSAEEYEAASEKGNIAGLVWRVDYDKETG